MTAAPRLRARTADGEELRLDAGQIMRLADRHPVAAALTEDGRFARLEVDGRRIRGRSMARRVRAGLATVSSTAVAADVTVGDHLAAAASTARAAELLAAVPLLADRGDDPAGVLSGGERRVLAWLTALAVAPRVVLLDRAGAGLDEAALAWAHATVDGWLDAGVAVLVHAGRPEEVSWVTHRADGTPRREDAAPDGTPRGGDPGAR